MEGKRSTTTFMVIMCLLILSLAVNSATAAQCSCCKKPQAKACCFACITAGGSDKLCKNTCCFPCFGGSKMAVVDNIEEMTLAAKMAEMAELAAKIEEGER